MQNDSPSRRPALAIGTPVETDQFGSQHSTATLSEVRTSLLEQLRALEAAKSEEALSLTIGHQVEYYTRYVLVRVYPDGRLRSECDAPDLGLDIITDRFRGMDWHPPERPRSPHWTMSDDPAATERCSSRAISTLERLLSDIPPDDAQLSLTLYSIKWAPEEQWSITQSGGALNVTAEHLASLYEIVSSIDELSNWKPTASPLVLAEGSSLDLMVSNDDRVALLEAIRPTEELSEALDEILEDLLSDLSLQEVHPIDMGNRIDGQPWGWLPMGADPRRFSLAPLPLEGESLVDFSAWMEASMTGEVASSGIRHQGTTAVAWFISDTQTSYLDVAYEVEDWDELLPWGLWWEGDPLCPACEEEHYSGWAVEVSVDPRFSPTMIGRALSKVWAPCNDHGKDRVSLEADGQNWHWEKDQWVLDADQGEEVQNPGSQ